MTSPHGAVPTTDPRQWLRAYWRDSLAADVPDDVNPVRYGATSLMLVRLVAEVEDIWGVTLPAYAFMKGECIDRLAELIQPPQ